MCLLKHRKVILLRKHVEPGLLVLHLLLSTVHSSGSPSAGRLQLDPSSAWILCWVHTTGFFLTTNETNACFAVRYAHETFWNSLSNLTANKWIPTLLGNKDRLNVSVFGNLTKHSRANYSKLPLTDTSLAHSGGKGGEQKNRRNFFFDHSAWMKWWERFKNRVCKYSCTVFNSLLYFPAVTQILSLNMPHSMLWNQMH